jgi:hypothetical protein
MQISGYCALITARQPERIHNEVSAKAKSKRQRERAEDLKILDSNSRKARASVTLLDGGPTPKATDNGKIPRRRNPAKKTKKKAKTANELMLEAWKYTYEHRHRRLTKP